MSENKSDNILKHIDTVEDIFISKAESDTSRFDIAGNMTTWHTHETYSGTGNHTSLWDDILKEKRAHEKKLKIENADSEEGMTK